MTPPARHEALERRLQTALHDTAMTAVPDRRMPPPFEAALLGPAPHRPATWWLPGLAAATVAGILILTIGLVRATSHNTTPPATVGAASSTTARPSASTSSSAAATQTSTPETKTDPPTVETPFGRAVVITATDGTQYWMSYSPAKSVGIHYTGTPGVTMNAGPGQRIAETSIGVANPRRKQMIKVTTSWGPGGEVLILAPTAARLPATACTPYSGRPGYCALTGVQPDPPNKMTGVVLGDFEVGIALNVVVPDSLDLSTLIAVLDVGHGRNDALARTGAE